MALVKVTFKTNKSQAQLDDSVIGAAGDRNRQAQKLMAHLKGLISGGDQGEIEVNVSPVQASGTLTLDTVVATDTCVIAGVTLTADATPAGDAEFLVGASDTDTATSLAAVINAHPTISLYVSAESAAAVVTLTAVEYGVASNLITVVGDTTITASAATLAGGTLGTVRSSLFNSPDVA